MSHFTGIPSAFNAHDPHDAARHASKVARIPAQILNAVGKVNKVLIKLKLPAMMAKNAHKHLDIFWHGFTVHVIPIAGMALSGIEAIIYTHHLIRDLAFFKRYCVGKKDKQAAINQLNDTFPLVPSEEAPTLDNAAKELYERNTKNLQKRIGKLGARKVKEFQVEQVKANKGIHTTVNTNKLFQLISTQAKKKMIQHAIRLTIALLFLAAFAFPPGGAAAMACLAIAIALMAIYMIALKPGFIETEGWNFSFKNIYEHNRDMLKAKWDWLNSPITDIGFVKKLDDKLTAWKLDMYVKTGYEIFAPHENIMAKL